MKVALSCSGITGSHMLDPRFGRCNYFLIYNQEGVLLKAIDNKGQLADGGAGIAAAQQMIDEDIDVIITGSMGPNAFDIIKNSGLKAYQCQQVACREALKLYSEGKLPELGEAGPSHMGLSP